MGSPDQAGVGQRLKFPLDGVNAGFDLSALMPFTREPCTLLSFGLGPLRVTRMGESGMGRPPCAPP
jgi:hypothetical protein